MNTYTCECCQETFEKDPGPEQRERDERAALQIASGKELAIVCEDCFAQIMSWAREHGEIEEA